MFPQFVSTAASFSRATALLTRVGTDAHFYDDPETENFSLLLDSKYEAEKTEGMKRLIALMSQGRDVSNFFPQVVKNVVTQSLELKKLVYIYLVHCAQKRPDEALLAINTFQKDLSDLNPLVRAWALRAMSGIQVRVVLPLVVMAVNKCARDPSPYVRICAAHAISKIFLLDREEHIDILEELICLLMNDNSPGVIGAVAAAFTVVCPEKLSMWGTQYHKLCRLLPDVNEWGQVMLIDILLRYAVGRFGYPEGSFGKLSVEAEGMFNLDSQHDKQKTNMQDELPLSSGKWHIEVDLKSTRGKDEDSFFSEEAGNLGSEVPADFWLTDTRMEAQHQSLQDIELFLQSTLPLFRSQNSAVVMAATGAHWLLASKENVKKIVKPLLFLLRSSFESQYVVLANIATFVKKAPSLFEDYYEEFFISSEDAEHIRILKLDILCLLATESSIQQILEEFQAYVRDPDRQFASNTVRAIGQCALRLPTVAKSCTKALLSLARRGPTPSAKNETDTEKRDQEVRRKERLSRVAISKSRQKAEGDKSSREALVITEAVSALRIIVHERPNENDETLASLFRGLDQLKVPAARAIVISMVGEFGLTGSHPEKVPVILQYLGGTFKQEEDGAKLQILNCAAKVVLLSETLSKSYSETPILLLDYFLRLAAQDLSYDIRDRARLYQQLLSCQLHNVFEHGKSNGNILGKRLQDLMLEESDTLYERKSDETVGYYVSNEEISGATNKPSILLNLAKQIFLAPKPLTILSSLSPDRSGFVCGTMSHMVVHRAPNYSHMPIPLSIELAALPSTARSPRIDRPNDHFENNSNGDYSGTVSEEEQFDRAFSPESTGSGSFYGEGEIHSDRPSSSSEDGKSESPGERPGRNRSEMLASSSRQRNDPIRKGRRDSKELGPLINLSDSDNEAGPSGKVTSDLGLLSVSELDAWLGSSEPTRDDKVSSSSTVVGYATVSIGKIEVMPKLHSLLDLKNGRGLDVKYSFERPALESAETVLGIKLYFENRSLETLCDIMVKDEDLDEDFGETGARGSSKSSGTDYRIHFSRQDKWQLEPGSQKESKLSVSFQDQIIQIRLKILCGGMSYSVKLVPEIGSLLRPTLLHPEAFVSKESQITGMHQGLCRIALIESAQSNSVSKEEDQVLLVARSIAQRVLSSAHVSLVSTIMPIGDSGFGVQALKSGGLDGLRLQFSGETLKGRVQCLIVITVLSDVIVVGDISKVEVSVKIKCEDTSFGLALLQELSNALKSLD